MTSFEPTPEAQSVVFFPYQSSILCSDRHILNGHPSALLWFTGLSGSGKSTLAHALEWLVPPLAGLRYYGYYSPACRGIEFA